MRPFAAIVGSSNFTGPGLQSNRELNLVHRVILPEEEAVDREAADFGDHFAEGLAAVRVDDGRWGYIDDSGEIVIDAKYGHASHFGDGLGFVQFPEADKFGFIDHDGNTVIDQPAAQLQRRGHDRPATPQYAQDWLGTGR